MIVGTSSCGTMSAAFRSAQANGVSSAPDMGLERPSWAKSVLALQLPKDDPQAPSGRTGL